VPQASARGPGISLEWSWIMRRVASLTVLLVMASVASLASAPAPAARAQATDRITSAAALPAVVKGLSPRNATQPTSLPALDPDPTPFITEFYGAAKSPAQTPAAKPAPHAVPEASIPANRPSAQ
jgi:hypothetical protein